VDSVAQTFKLDLDIEYQWYDPRVVKKNLEPELEYDEVSEHFKHTPKISCNSGGRACLVTQRNGSMVAIHNATLDRVSSSLSRL